MPINCSTLVAVRWFALRWWWGNLNDEQLNSFNPRNYCSYSRTPLVHFLQQRTERSRSARRTKRRFQDKESDDGKLRTLTAIASTAASSLHEHRRRPPSKRHAPRRPVSLGTNVEQYDRPFCWGFRQSASWSGATMPRSQTDYNVKSSVAFLRTRRRLHIRRHAHSKRNPRRSVPRPSCPLKNLRRPQTPAACPLATQVLSVPVSASATFQADVQSAPPDRASPPPARNPSRNSRPALLQRAAP